MMGKSEVSTRYLLNTGLTLLITSGAKIPAMPPKIMCIAIKPYRKKRSENAHPRNVMKLQ